MDLPIKQVYLAENEKDIFARLSEEGIDTKIFASKFQYLFQKIYNNEVGYYSFRQDDILYKFIVLPKTISLDAPEKEREFVNYLLHYYRVNNKYGYDKTKKIPNSLLNLAFESNNKNKEIHNPIELFEYHKTKSILQQIEAFFQKHKHYKRVEQDYISQSIKHKLNLGKNIKEVNKSKIHQTKKVDVFYSQMATVSYYALKLYMQKKLTKIDEQNSDLRRYVEKIGTFIARKYQIDKGFSLSLPKLYSHKISKIFQKKQEHKMLLANLRSLFGYEQFYHDNQTLAELRHDLDTSSFFINPSLFYEWYVYDILQGYATNHNKTIHFDKKEGTATKYKLNKASKSANPDYILEDQDKNVKVVIDAKWKNVDSLNDIKSDDYLKLQFDSNLLEQNSLGVVPYLIYPTINMEDRVCSVTYKGENIFTFNLLEIDMDFANKDNSPSFSYDFEVKANEMQMEEEIEANRYKGSQFSKAIEASRNETITKLIEAENEEEKESIGGLFDEKLWQKSEALTNELEIKILPEVQILLDEFSGVMEEESITFLKSTSTIYAHYKDIDDISFDFSMPGSGLWKLIEMELNTSFIWQLRILSGVCSSQSPWVKICKPNTRIDQDLDSGKKVSLSMPDKKDKSKLQSVMLGGIKLLLDDQSTLSEFEEYFRDNKDDEHFLKNNLLHIVEKVIDFRNEHAHIRAMSKETFDELWKLLFEKDGNDNSILTKLFVFKQNMKRHMSN